jgi:hypothetical protein
MTPSSPASILVIAAPQGEPTVVDESIPVLLSLRKDQEQTVCIARLVRQGQELFAVPFQPSQEMQPYRPRKIKLDEQSLELWPAHGPSPAIYHYRPLVMLPQ